MTLSGATAHRIVASITARLAALRTPSPHDRRWSWVVDGTLVPTRDHMCAACSKNYRWSCNAQILVRRRDLRIVATVAGGPGNRNDPILRRRAGAISARHARSGRRSFFLAGGYTDRVTKASAKVLTDALALTTEERMDLAAELLASVDGPADPDWEQAWQLELDRRAAEADQSGTPPAEWSEVRARALSKLATR